MCMELSEFEQLIEGTKESQTLEFKGPCFWDSKKLGKDILALSNVQDRGYIVIGVIDHPFERLGVDEAQAKTFDLEIMRDQMAEIADPFVNFAVDQVVDANGLIFITITVFEFSGVPVLSRKKWGDVERGKLYYRSQRHRPASEPVSNSYELRDILDRAARKIMTQRISQGYTVEVPKVNEYYDNELGGL